VIPILGSIRPPPEGASSGFSVSRVREPGTAEEDPAGLRPEGDRRMPGTRPPCPLRQSSPVRDVSCSVGHVILVPRGAMKSRIGDVWCPGPTGAVPVVSPVAFRSPACRFFFSDDWLRHARCGEPAAATAKAVGPRREMRQSLRAGDLSTRKLGRDDMDGGAAGPARSPETGHGPRSRGRSRTEPFRSTATAAAVGTAAKPAAANGPPRDARAGREHRFRRVTMGRFSETGGAPWILT
jgi:hypothetical protein